MWIFWQLTRLYDALAEEIVLLANLEHASNRVCVTPVDTSKNATVAEKRLARMVEANEPRYVGIVIVIQP